MKLQSRNLPVLLSLLALLLASLACSFSGTTLENGGAEIKLSLKEDALNTMLENSTNQVDAEDVLLKRITRVELHDGFLRVFGDYDRPGGGEARGSYDVTFRAENGALKGEIIGVAIEGVRVDDARVTRLNEKLADALTRSARESQGEVEFNSVTITDNALDMQMMVHWKAKDARRTE